MTLENTVELKKQSISLIVKRYRGEKSLRDFAGDLSSKIPEPVSYTSIKNWEDEIFLPTYYPILAIALQYDDWRRQFALDIMAVLKPEYYIPDQLNISSQNS